jgi:hypothetical protein
MVAARSELRNPYAPRCGEGLCKELETRAVPLSSNGYEPAREAAFAPSPHPTVIEIANMYNFTNRMSPACGMIPKDEYYVLAR